MGLSLLILRLFLDLLLTVNPQNYMYMSNQQLIAISGGTIPYVALASTAIRVINTLNWLNDPYRRPPIN